MKQMATRNDITGDAIISRQSNENFRNGYDAIFRKKEVEVKPEQPTKEKDNESGISEE